MLAALAELAAQVVQEVLVAPAELAVQVAQEVLAAPVELAIGLAQETVRVAALAGKLQRVPLGARVKIR